MVYYGVLLVAVMQEATKEARREGLKELLYADDLVLMAESEEEAVEKFNAWKRGMKRRELRVYIHGKDEGYDIWRGVLVLQVSGRSSYLFLDCPLVLHPQPGVHECTAPPITFPSAPPTHSAS